MKGDFHIHSKYSFDSIMDPKRILKVVKSKGFDTVAITDHNTIKGALEAKKFEDEIGIQVIIGSEIKTDIGDLIGLNLERKVNNSYWEMVITEIKDQGGIVVLPHPYRDHTIVNEVAQKVDLIEIWNARSPPEQNKKALELMTYLHCKAIMGSDAHLYSELGNVNIQLDPLTLATEVIFKRKYATAQEIKWSQITGHIRKGDIIKLLSGGLNYIWKEIIC